MNSSKSGNVTLALQTEAVEHALSDELEPLFGREIEPRREIVVLVDARHRDGPSVATFRRLHFAERVGFELIRTHGCAAPQSG
jgi:hypothetical protein